MTWKQLIKLSSDELKALDLSKYSQKMVLWITDRILILSGSDTQGNKNPKRKSRSQSFFERRILMTPMGNGMR